VRSQAAHGASTATVGLGLLGSSTGRSVTRVLLGPEKGKEGRAILTPTLPYAFAEPAAAAAAQRSAPMDARAPASPPPPHAPFEYRYTTEFQSHEPEFDYLKSLEIEEKINQARARAMWGIG
jgi:hypothetical protein